MKHVSHVYSISIINNIASQIVSIITVRLTVNYNTFCFATIDKVFYLVVSVLTTCFGP
jgi:hypothetical protein